MKNILSKVFVSFLVVAFVLSIGFVKNSFASVEEVVVGPIVVVSETPVVESAPVVEPSESPSDIQAGEEIAPAHTQTASVISAVLTTDKDDYMPGETATIFGKFFGALQNFILKVFGSDENDQNYTEQVETITTNSDGWFSFSYLLDNLYRPFYEVVVSTLGGEKVAETWFRDAAVDKYDQCSNNLGTGYPTGDTGCRWINGAINASNSTYQEGDSTVQRLSVKGFESGSVGNTITFTYGTTKAGKHAYDFLTTFDASENYVDLADRCDGITGCTGVGISDHTRAIPTDPDAQGLDSAFGTRLMTMRGGTITAVSAPTLVSGTYGGGDTETAITVTFDVPASGLMCSTKTVQGQPVTSCGVALWFGAHIAKGTDWTDGFGGASSISGSPYHVALSALNSGSIGNRDNQMQAAAIVPEAPLPATLTLLKTVIIDNGGTAVDTAWTLTATGNTNISGAEGNGSVTNAVVTPGTYALGETGGPSGYSASLYSCAKNGGSPVVSNSISLVDGDNAVCTITNDDIAPSLIVIKDVINDNGGTLGASAFTMNVTAINPSDASFPGEALGTTITLDAGAYSVAEPAVAGYATTYSADCTSTAVIGVTKTCTVTNNDISPILTIVKTVINNNGGTATVSDFFLQVGASNRTSGVAGTVPAGTYSLAETGPAGYTQTSLTCSNSGTGNVISVTLTLGENVTCTFVNDDIAPTLTLNKIVVNDNGGTTSNTAWTLTATGALVSPTNLSGATPVSSVATFKADTYTLGESVIAGYSASLYSCVKNSGSAVAGNSITLANGDTAVCTITNDDIAPTLTLNKIVVNDNGGTTPASNWTLTADGGLVAGTLSGLGVDLSSVDVVSGATFNAGTYALSESGTQTGYTASAWSCVKNGAGAVDGASVTLGLGDTATCTITNDDQPGHLIVSKVTNPASDITTQFSITASGGTIISPTATENIVGGGSVDYTVNAGTYNVSEALQTGWTQTSNNCTNVVVANGATANCTITNTQKGRIIIVKDAVPNSAQDFSFTGSGSIGAFLLDDDGEVINLPKQRDFEVLPGTFSVSESATTGWKSPKTATCTDGSPVSAIVVSPGETVTCTFTNQKLAKITLVKNTQGGNGTFDFVMTGTTLPSSAQLATTGGTANQVFSNIDPDNTYSITETPVPAGWEKISATCDNGDPVTAITPNSGEEIICTFTNGKLPTLQLVKTVTNDNGGGLNQTNFPVSINNVSAVWGNVVTLTPGNYTASETQQTGYSTSGWGGNCATNGTVALAYGDNKICTITNDDIAPQLIVIKHVINDNGGTILAAGFTTTITGVTTATPSAPGAEAPGINNTLTSIGAYTVDEGAHVGYTKTLSAECSGTIALGETKTCTVTNNDIAPSLTLNKVVVNDNGGTTPASNWTLTADGGLVAGTLSGLGVDLSSVDVVSGASFKAGTYMLSESGTQTGYTASAWSCVKNGAGAVDGASVTLGLGDTATCTIVNNDIAPKLTIIKDAQPNDLQDFSFNGGVLGAFSLDDDATVTGIGANGDVDQPQSKLFNNLSVGSYTVTETLPSTFWTFTGASCVVTDTEIPFAFTPVTNGVTVNLGLADDVTCTITNFKESPTRTQGFWQTHTDYTSGVFTNLIYGINNSMTIGTAIHNKVITTSGGPVTTGTQKLFGAYWSNISKKTVGGNRTAIEKARMQLLQQLVTAKLNCAAFGCGGTVPAMIITADNAYAAGIVAPILASASLLDAYNNSGDTLIIGPAGSATPKISQGLADKAFWNTP